jgi:hypothetical protein
MRPKTMALTTAAALALTVTTAVHADMPGDVPDKVKIGIGGIVATAYTDGALGSTTAGVGASVNFEDSFGLPESRDIARTEIEWHVAKRQFVDFGFFRLARSGNRTIDRDVSWGDFIFQSGAIVDARFETDFSYVAWRYVFLDLPQVRISGSAGFNYLTLKAALAANGNVTDQDGNVVTGDVDESAKVSAPVPQLGLQLDWALTRRLAVLVYTRQIYVTNVAGVTGGIGETAMRLQWWYAKHAGISGGIDKEDIDLKSYESGDTRARFRYTVRGLSFYLNFAF